MLGWQCQLCLCTGRSPTQVDVSSSFSSSYFFLIPPLTRAKPITCTYFLVTGLRVHLGCRSGAAAEGWSSRSRRGSVGALGVALSESELSGRERRAFLGVLVFHLYSQIFRDIGTRSLPLPVFLFSSYPRRRRLPVLLPPQKTKKKNSQSLCVSPSLSLSACCCRVFKGWALSLCLFLLRLSLLVTPPCVPTPHLSVSQELRSPAALQRSGAALPATRHRQRAGGQCKRSCCRCTSAQMQRERRGGVGGFNCIYQHCSPHYLLSHAPMLCCSSLLPADDDEEKHPCHLTDVTQQANWGHLSWAGTVGALGNVSRLCSIRFDKCDTVHSQDGRRRGTASSGERCSHNHTLGNREGCGKCKGVIFLFSFSSIGILHKGKNVVCMSRLMRICILSAKRSQIMQRRCAVCNVQSKNLRLFSNPGFALKMFLLRRGGGSPQILTILG